MTHTYLEQNLKGICDKFGVDFQGFLSDFNIDNVYDLTILDLEAVCEEYEVDLNALLFKPLYLQDFLKEKLAKIKFLILDVDGVLTDGGMYYSESGDQSKKFNTKDGMAILNLTKNNVQVGIISSGFVSNTVKKRAEILGIQHCYIGRKPKIEILKEWCAKLQVKLEEVAVIGDDINDLCLIKDVGFSACPSDAIREVKSQVTLILNRKGGDGCVREFIDDFLNVSR
jgi:3-deoxy-D-manno-octulosonate 8-phosphate phosphatase (KDO 8-P phosphatase)